MAQVPVYWLITALQRRRMRAEAIHDYLGISEAEAASPDLATTVAHAIAQ